MVQAVLFDLDGTLLDRETSIKKFISNQYDRWSAHLGCIAKEAYSNTFIRLDNRGYTPKEDVYKKLLQIYQLSHIQPHHLHQDYLTNFSSFSTPFPNLIYILERLTQMGIKLGIITNGRGKFQMDNIEALQIENYFGTILVSEWEGIKKPDSRIFNKALQQLQVTAEGTLFVGDHPEKDIQGARGAGMKGVWKKNDYWTEGETDHTIEDLMDILKLV